MDGHGVVGDQDEAARRDVGDAATEHVDALHQDAAGGLRRLAGPRPLESGQRSLVPEAGRGRVGDVDLGGLESKYAGHHAGDVGQRPHVAYEGLLPLQRAEVVRHEVELNDDGRGLGDGQRDGRERRGRRRREAAAAHLRKGPETERVRGPVQMGHQLLLHVEDVDAVDAARRDWRRRPRHELLDVAGDAAGEVDVAEGPPHLERAERVPAQENEGLGRRDAVKYAGQDAAAAAAAVVAAASTGAATQLRRGPAEQDVATGHGDVIPDAQVRVGQHRGQQHLVVGALSHLAQQQRLGDEQGERVRREPDVDELRLLPLAEYGRRAAAGGRLVEHGGRVVAGQAREQEAVLDVVAAQRTEAVRDEADEVLRQQRQHARVLHAARGQGVAGGPPAGRHALRPRTRVGGPVLGKALLEDPGDVVDVVAAGGLAVAHEAACRRPRPGEPVAGRVRPRSIPGLGPGRLKVVDAVGALSPARLADGFVGALDLAGAAEGARPPQGVLGSHRFRVEMASSTPELSDQARGDADGGSKAVVSLVTMAGTARAWQSRRETAMKSQRDGSSGGSSRRRQDRVYQVADVTTTRKQGEMRATHCPSALSAPMSCVGVYNTAMTARGVGVPGGWPVDGPRCTRTFVCWKGGV